MCSSDLRKYIRLFEVYFQLFEYVITIWPIFNNVEVFELIVLLLERELSLCSFDLIDLRLCPFELSVFELVS